MLKFLENLTKICLSAFGGEIVAGTNYGTSLIHTIYTIIDVLSKKYRGKYDKKNHPNKFNFNKIKSILYTQTRANNVYLY